MAERSCLSIVLAAGGTSVFSAQDAEAMVDVDSTAVDALEDLRLDLQQRDVVLAMARVKSELREDLDRSGLLARMGADRVYPTLPTALAAFRDWRSTHPERDPDS